MQQETRKSLTTDRLAEIARDSANWLKPDVPVAKLATDIDELLTEIADLKETCRTLVKTVSWYAQAAEHKFPNGETMSLEDFWKHDDHGFAAQATLKDPRVKDFVDSEFL